MTTKIGLLGNVTRVLGELIMEGQPTAATATTMDFAQLIQRDANQLLGFRMFIYAGGGATQSRVVASFSPADRRIVFEEALSPIGSTNAQVILTKTLDGDDLEDAFQSAYTQYYSLRNDIRAKWNSWIDGLTQRQTQLYNEKTSEQSAWVTERQQEMTEWHGQQVSWEAAISAEWRAYLSRLDFNDAFRVPSLNIKTVGTMAIGTVPIGSLNVPTLSSLAPAPSISTIASYGSVVPDDTLLTLAFRKETAMRFLGTDKFDKRYDATNAEFNNRAQAEDGMVQNLINSTNTMFEQHQGEFDSTWNGVKDRYQQGWERLTSSYEIHKANTESRFLSIKNTFGV